MAFSEWASSHPDEEIRANAAMLQNHSQRVHNLHNRKDKTAIAARQAIALEVSQLNCDDSDSEVDKATAKSKAQDKPFDEPTADRGDLTQRLAGLDPKSFGNFIQWPQPCF